MRLPLTLITIVPIVLLSCRLADAEKSTTLFSPIASLGLKLMENASNHIPDEANPEKNMRDGFAQINQLVESLNISERITISEIQRYMTNHHRSYEYFAEYINKINELYAEFQHYISGVFYENVTIINVANACIDGDHYLYKIDPLYRLLKPVLTRSESFFKIFTENQKSMADAAGLCNTTISLQQQIHRVYNIIALSMVKGHLMKIYSYHLLNKYKRQSFSNQMVAVIADYKEKMAEVEKVVVEVMTNAPRDLRPCDADVDEEGETFMQLKWLFGALVINQIYLSSGTKPSCSKDCRDYQEASVHVSNWKIAPQHTCKGKVYNCFKGRFDDYCPATMPYRRYNGFKEYRSLKNYDPAKGDATCPGNPLSTGERPTAEWWRRCDECVCSCDDVESEATVRTFSTKRVTSDKHDNRVITGVKLVETQRVIHIQIQQGVLGPNGAINETTVEWKSVESFDYTDRHTPKSDYFTIDHDNNKLYLDTKAARAGHVLTGIKFMKYEDGIILAIEVTEFDYVTGILNIQKTVASEVRSRNWHKLQLRNSDIPTLADTENIVNTANNLYVKFRQTDWGKDASQTAIPFIDIQPVISNPPAPLSGAGMFHKTVPNYGGFIGMKLISYDYQGILNPVQRSVDDGKVPRPHV